MSNLKSALSLTGIFIFLFAASVSGQEEVAIPKFEIGIKSGIYRNTQLGNASLPYGSKYLTDNYATLFLSVKRRSAIKGLHYGVSFGTFRFESNITPEYSLNNSAKEEIPSGTIYTYQRLYSGCFELSYRRILHKSYFIETTIGLGGLFQGEPQFHGSLKIMTPNVFSPEIIHKISLNETNRLSLLSTLEASFGKMFKDKYSASIGLSYMRNFGHLERSGLTPIQDNIQINDQSYHYDFSSRFSAYALSLKFALYLNQFKSSNPNKKEYKSSKALKVELSSVNYLGKNKDFNWGENTKTAKGISISIGGLRQIKSSLFSIGFKTGMQNFSRTTEFNFIYNNKDKEAIPTGSMTVNQLALFAYPELIVQKTLKRITIHAELGSGIMYMLRPSLEYQMTTAKGNDQLNPEVLVSGLIINTHRLCNFSTFGLGADYRLYARHTIGISASYFASPQFSNRTEFAPVRAVVQVNDQSYAYYFSTTIIGIKAGLRYTYDF